MKVNKQILILFIVFLCSRSLAGLLGVQYEPSALYRYWQFLDVDTLKNNLLAGLWWDHTQPPVFNLLLGLVVKLGGVTAPFLFALILKLISFSNGVLIYQISRVLTQHVNASLIVSLFYLLSPATIIFETELLYTPLLSLFLLIAFRSLIRLHRKITYGQVWLLFGALSLICLTRSMYHLFFLLVIGIIIFIILRKKNGIGKLVVPALVSFLLVGGWYLKNRIMFGGFYASSWTGMNLSRNVFHNNPPLDSSSIGHIEAFSPITDYKQYLSYTKSDRTYPVKDLTTISKNDSFDNLKHIGYIRVSQLYMAACKIQIRQSPQRYLFNALQSAITFFAPASRYPTMEYQSSKIWPYDLIYSFNLSHFANTKNERRVALLLSAIPKMLLYGWVFYLALQAIRRRDLYSYFYFLAITIIGYVFLVSSLVERFENMRFRYETEPVFLIVAVSLLLQWRERKIRKI